MALFNFSHPKCSFCGKRYRYDRPFVEGIDGVFACRPCIDRLFAERNGTDTSGGSLGCSFCGEEKQIVGNRRRAAICFNCVQGSRQMLDEHVMHRSCSRVRPRQFRIAGILTMMTVVAMLLSIAIWFVGREPQSIAVFFLFWGTWIILLMALGVIGWSAIRERHGPSSTKRNKT